MLVRKKPYFPWDFRYKVNHFKGLRFGIKQTQTIWESLLDSSVQKLNMNITFLFTIKGNMSPPTEEEYIASLNEKQKKAYFIAKAHLGTLFRLEQAVGYLRWRTSK
jgi:hypothetical protein